MNLLRRILIAGNLIYFLWVLYNGVDESNIINAMKKPLFLILALIVVFIVVFVANQFITLRKAHSSFGNYYAFRGCTQLLEKTDSYGLCKLSSGQTIKIVKFGDKWYLDGDLPWACLGKTCLGF